jgi:hypothetical protein
MATRYRNVDLYATWLCSSEWGLAFVRGQRPKKMPVEDVARSYRCAYRGYAGDLHHPWATPSSGGLAHDPHLKASL